jgi:hypothetical protein
VHEYVCTCPECRTDFLLHVERCSDCGGALVTRLESDPLPATTISGQGEPAAAWQPPPGDYETIFSASFVSELQPLVARLAQAGIPSKVDAGYSGFALRVRREERRAAVEALGELIGEVAAAEREVERHFDAASGYSRCPACGTELAPRAIECRECGLQVGAEPARCERCGGELDLATQRCAACGGPAPVAE